MPNPHIPTVWEKAELGGLITAEAVATKMNQSILPMIADPELRQQVESCIQNGKDRLTALMGVAKEHNLAH